tara:strand:+ start:1137 stop:1295 length:159 start_codon:yes stop_codon:yes gene_type:complete
MNTPQKGGYIWVTMKCDECGHTFGEENYEALSVAVAEAEAANGDCPYCAKED